MRDELTPGTTGTSRWELYGLPMAPLVLGLVIGALLEKSLVQTSALGDGNLLAPMRSPIVLGVLGVAVLIGVGPSIVSALRSRGRGAANRGRDARDPRPTAAGSTDKEGEL